ncbi:MAG: hypothetical protein JO068_14725 [Hyphomicrobiales bacterium]|nr:hypothetical protein [Hyphomicrobiales bacterium]
MNKIITGLTAAVALGGAALVAPTSASANPLVIAPVAAAAILGGTAVAGAAVGAAVTHPYPYPAYAYPNGYGYVAPASGPVVAAVPNPDAGCYLTNARIRGVWHRVQVCD